MNWEQNAWGGWREAEHGLFVGQTPGRWWRLWVRDVVRPEVFRRADEAKRFAEELVGGE